MSAIRTVFKIILLALALAAGQIIGGIVSGMFMPAANALPMPAHDGPFDVGSALLLASLAYALAMTPYAARLRGGFLSRTAVVFVLFYIVGWLLSVIETLYFNAYIKMSQALIDQMALTGLVQAAVAAPVAAALWRGARAEAEAVSGLWWRLALIVPMYILVYFGAGEFIAYQGAAVRAYYDYSRHIDQAQLVLLQVARGSIWAGLAWMSVRRLTGSLWSRAVIVGVVFAVVMVMPLLYPNPYMPWDVRKMHILEMGTSNFLFGLLGSGLLLAGLKRRPA